MSLIVVDQIKDWTSFTLPLGIGTYFVDMDFVGALIQALLAGAAIIISTIITRQQMNIELYSMRRQAELTKLGASLAEIEGRLDRVNSGAQILLATTNCFYKYTVHAPVAERLPSPSGSYNLQIDLRIIRDYACQFPVHDIPDSFLVIDYMRAVSIINVALKEIEHYHQYFASQNNQNAIDAGMKKITDWRNELNGLYSGFESRADKERVAAAKVKIEMETIHRDG